MNEEETAYQARIDDVTDQLKGVEMCLSFVQANVKDADFKDACDSAFLLLVRVTRLIQALVKLRFNPNDKPGEI